MHWHVSALMLANKLQKAIGLNPELTWSDSGVREERAASVSHYRSAVFLDGQIDKILGCPFGQLKPQVEKMFEFDSLQRPILSVTLKNCYVIEKYILTGRKSKTLNVKYKEEFPIHGEFLEIAEPAVAASSFLGVNFFGHWLRDDCATEVMAHEAGEVYWIDTPEWPDKAAYQAAFGQTPRQANGRLFRQLTLFDDVGQNPHKAARFRELRARLRATRPAANPDIVYLRRGAGGAARTLVNEAEVLALMERLGATIIEPENNADALISACLGARIVVSIEGSQLSHALHTLRDNGGLLVIQPPDRFYGSHRDWSAELDMTFGFVVADPAEGGFSVDLDDLERTLAMVSARIDTCAAL